MHFNGPALLLAAIIAVLSPLAGELPIGLRLPMIVVEVALGIVIGPHMLGWASPDGVLSVLGFLGLIFLFFLAGMDLNFGSLRGRPLTLGVWGWLFSVAIAFCAAEALYLAGIIRTPLLVGVAATTTGMGALLPILRDSGELNTRFGRYVIAAGAVGEFGPVALLSLLLTREHTQWMQTALMIFFVALAALAVVAALHTKTPKVVSFLAATMNSSSQLPVRISILILALLICVAEKFGLDMILGAFTAGLIVSLGSQGREEQRLHHRLDAIGYGFLIPMFFVTSGMHFDVQGLVSSPKAMLRVPAFLLLLFVARSAPTIFYRYELQKSDHLPFAFYSATSLPLIIAIAEIGVQSGRMQSDNATALVGAGMLSLLFFPIVAMIARRGSQKAATQASTRAAEAG